MRPRFCGVLLHISSLPSTCGIGDMGPSAYAFADLLLRNGINHWQFLPVTPTSPFIGNSPYSSPSAFAGNLLFISPEKLAEKGFVSYADLDCATERMRNCGLEPERVDYARVEEQRAPLLQAAFERNRLRLRDDPDFQHFCAEHNHWLHAYARFVTLKEEHGGASWAHWPEPLRRCTEQALQRWDAHAGAAMERQKFFQYLFFSQWTELHGYCKKAGLKFIGDLPIYVTHDSADVWANPHLFKLDADFQPEFVAGVPPDYFSATGQRWGNPVYNWEAMQRDGFAWWRRRLAHNLLLTDLVRLDHFRGFCGYWEIPAAEKTAVNGQWRDAPGPALFASFRRFFGELPLIAEDLGVITPDVRELMHAFGLPGMKVLQFAFDGIPARNPDVPFRHRPNQVVYTGTHDNPPSRAWFAAASPAEKANLRAWLGYEVSEDGAHEALLRLALASPAELAVLPVQDILGLGLEARMNMPSTSSGNWEWRISPCRMERDLPSAFARLGEMCNLYGRR